MSGFRVGLVGQIVNSPYSPTAFGRAGHVTAIAGGIESYWYPDHLNALIPRSIATTEFLGAEKLLPKVDAYLEPWTMLGHLAARNRLRMYFLRAREAWGDEEAAVDPVWRAAPSGALRRRGFTSASLP